MTSPSPDPIETWIHERYGRITYSSVVTPLCEVHTAVVPLFAGVGIGMGATREMAMHDLYEDLCQRPELPTMLTGFWRDRRDQIARDL